MLASFSDLDCLTVIAAMVFNRVAAWPVFESDILGALLR